MTITISMNVFLFAFILLIGNLAGHFIAIYIVDKILNFMKKNGNKKEKEE